MPPRLVFRNRTHQNDGQRQQPPRAGFAAENIINNNDMHNNRFPRVGLNGGFRNNYIIPIPQNHLVYLPTYEMYGRHFMGKKKDADFGTQMMSDFFSFFGTTPKLCSILWFMILNKNNQQLPKGASPQHLLWALLFMKTYNSEGVISSIVGSTPKTARKWIWWAAHEMSTLGDDVIDWENRLMGNTSFRHKVSVDGTDFRIQEPSPFDSKWYSHKFHGPGLRYEVACCIETGWIVWIHGPFPCGSSPDIRIFRQGLRHAVVRGVERVEADKGYRGEPFFISTPDDHQNEVIKQAKACTRARQEHINRHLKHFGCLAQIFRHGIAKHSTLFWAIAVLTQLAIKHGERNLYHVDYVGPTYQDNFYGYGTLHV